MENDIMDNKASLSVNFKEEGSEVVISGTYNDVISAICASIKGLIANMLVHPKYLEIKSNSKLSDEEFEQELIYSVVLNIMDRLDEHYVLSMNNVTGELVSSITDEITNDDTNNIETDIDFDEFEQFLNNKNNE